MSAVGKIAITGCVITHNEARGIERCLRSLAFCDELLVVDSRSTDGTRELAAALGARVIDRDWPGFRSQREFAIAAAAHDWILFLDADEELAPEGAALLRGLRDGGMLGGGDGAGAVRGYWLPRSNRYYGRFLRHGDWRSDRGLRLFDRRHARVAGREVHEHIEVDGRTDSLAATVLHDSYRDLDEQFAKLSKYARLMAESWYQEGRRASVLACLVNPSWRFLRSFVLRLGFLDGWRGYVVALAEARYVREKYLRLLVLDRTDGARG
jgi:glycosyltransferase involved in cell wall biosynthesis